MTIRMKNKDMMMIIIKVIPTKGIVFETVLK